MRKRIVIAGAGFAGLTVARLVSRWLDPSEAEIVLVEGSGYHTLRPKLPQAVGGRIACAVRVPLPAVLGASPVQLVSRSIARVDPAAHRLEWEDGGIEADVLVLALGAEAAAPEGIASSAEAALPLWSFDQACALRRRMQFLMAARQRGRPADLSVAVVGGGFVGVEVAAELQARLNRALGERARGLVRLVEAAPRLLPRLSPWASAAAAHRLQRLGVQVVTGSQVERVEPGLLHLRGGQSLPAGTVVWAAAHLTAPRLLREAGLVDTTGRVPVAPTLEVPGFPGVFALGDCAYVPGHGPAAAEPSAHRAETQAWAAAHNVRAAVRGRPLAAARPRRNLYLLALGPGWGLLDGGPGLRLQGRLPALLKEAVMLRHLHGLGGWGLLRRAVGPVVADALRPGRWEQEPLPDGAL